MAYEYTRFEDDFYKENRESVIRIVESMPEWARLPSLIELVDEEDARSTENADKH